MKKNGAELRGFLFRGCSILIKDVAISISNEIFI